MIKFTFYTGQLNLSIYYETKQKALLCDIFSLLYLI